VIEKIPARAARLSEELDKAIVLQGDAADPELLEDEGIESVDVFCALTNDDEDNILSATLAKRLGARKAMALINRSVYVDLLESASLDVAISPAQITISTLLRHVRRGHVVAVHSLRRGAAEAIEVIVHGDRTSSRVVGHAICDIPLPPGTTIGAMVRGEEVIIAHHDTVIQPEDHVILFVVDKRRIREVERLFQAEPQPT
jgi:trk system potassium uptake protein TrkA